MKAQMMKKHFNFFFILFIGFFINCSNPIRNNNSELVMTSINWFAYLIQLHYNPTNKTFIYLNNNIIYNKWTTLDLKYNFKDSLKILSISPKYCDTIYLDTLWLEDTNNNIHIYTLNNFFPDDTLKRVGYGASQSVSNPVDYQIINNNYLVFCPNVYSDTTYSADISFLHPIISNGHIKIRLKINKYIQ